MKILSILNNLIYWKYLESIDNTQKRHFDDLLGEVDSIRNDLINEYSIEELNLIRDHAISTENSIKDVAVLAVMLAFIFGLGTFMLQKLITVPSLYSITIFLISMVIITVYFIIIVRLRNKTLVSTALVKELISSYLDEVGYKGDYKPKVDDDEDKG